MKRQKEINACTNRNIPSFSPFLSYDPFSELVLKVLLFARRVSIRHQKGSLQKENEKQSKEVALRRRLCSLAINGMPEALDTVYLHVIKVWNEFIRFRRNRPVPSRSYLLSAQVGVSRLVGGLLNTYAAPYSLIPACLIAALYATYIFSNAQINID